MTVQDEVIQEVQSKNKAKKREKEKVQNEMDDARSIDYYRFCYF